MSKGTYMHLNQFGIPSVISVTLGAESSRLRAATITARDAIRNCSLEPRSARWVRGGDIPLGLPALTLSFAWTLGGTPLPLLTIAWKPFTPRGLFSVYGRTS